jgi:Fe-S-cluster containining protein
MELPNLTKKEESEICLSCGECCKKYSITILPKEAKEIADFLDISLKEFLEEKCEIYVKIFPKSIPGPLTVPSAFFPKKVGELLYNHFDYIPAGFFVVPQIALKRVDNSNCQFLNEDNTCKIYEARPTPCKLFPFMVTNSYEEKYDFCELQKRTNKDYKKESKKYQEEINKYFEDVENNNFEKVWEFLPTKTKLFLSDTYLGIIKKDDLLKMLSKRITG